MYSESELIRKIDDAYNVLEECSKALDKEIEALAGQQTSFGRELVNKKTQLDHLTNGDDPSGELVGDKGALMLDRMRLEEQYRSLCKEREGLNFDSSASEISSLTAQINDIEGDIDKIRKEISEVDDALTGKKEERRNLSLRPEVEQYHFLQEEFDDLCKAVRNTITIRYSQDIRENLSPSNQAQFDRTCSELNAAMDSQTTNEEARHE